MEHGGIYEKGLILTRAVLIVCSVLLSFQNKPNTHKKKVKYILDNSYELINIENLKTKNQKLT